MESIFVKDLNKLESIHRQSPWARVTLLIVLAYEGVGCLMGGALLVASPDGRYMDMSAEMMNGVFGDFLIPGIILLGLGVINILAFAFLLRRVRTDWIASVLALGGLLIWFITEIIIIQELHWLHIMWGLPVLLGWVTLIPLIAQRNPTIGVLNFLLACGVFSSIWYTAINIYVPMQDVEYVISSYTVSELSAIGAPTRLLWVLLCLGYSLSFAAFGWGVLLTAKGNPKLHLVGGLIIAYCILGFYWPPMHLRGNEPTLTDTLHIVWAILINIFMWLFMGFGATALPKMVSHLYSCFNCFAYCCWCIDSHRSTQYCNQRPNSNYWNLGAN